MVASSSKVHVELFIFNFLGICISLVNSDFNFEEIYGVKYGFEISKEPVLLKENPTAGNTVLLSSKHGQQYQCVLPELETLEKQNEDNHILSKEEIPLLLEPLKKKCLYNNKGWWTYEVCFGKGIYQYHEEANEIVGDKISLGVFSNETDWSQEKIEKVKPKPGKNTSLKKFHSQYYVNGSECDLTGKARETQIKIFCEEGSADLVLRVDEPSSCFYVITVYTGKLCKHSLFRSSNAQEPQPITCSPALSEDRYKIYIEKVESKKKAKEEAEAARLQAQKARAAAADLDAEDDIEQDGDSSVKRKKRSKRSLIWPWEDPGVESEDEVWIDGRIEDSKLDVHRYDLTKGQKTNEKGERSEEGLSIMSQKIQRKREERRKENVEEKQKGDDGDDIKENEEELRQHGEKKAQTEDDEAKQKDSVTIEQDNGKDNKEKDSEKESASEDRGEDKTTAPADVHKKIEKEEPKKEVDPLHEKWKAKMEDTLRELRSTLKGKLVQLGIDPEVLDQKFKEKLGTAGGDKILNDKSSTATRDESSTGTPKTDGEADDDETEEPEEEEKPSQETEKKKKTATKEPFLKSLAEIAKFLNNDMMRELLDAAAETQAEMERQFNKERSLMKSNVEEMRAKIKEIEDAEAMSEVKNEQLGQTMSKIKASMDRFEKTNEELDQDMQEIKELNSEIFSVAKNKNSGDTKRADLVQLSVKTNRLLKKILLRRFQLEQEAKYIKTMSNKVANREDGDDVGATIDPRENGIDKVISKLKTMILDLDSTEDKPGGVTGSAEATSESTVTAGVRDEDSKSDLGADSGVKVRVSKVKKVVLDDDDDDDDLEMKETDLDAKEMEELNMEKRLRLATKKMEEMVKEQLRNSGVVPSGKIRVKIVTSKDALENMDGKNDLKLLSEREETQFRDMILGLLGASPDAGKEKRRQQDLESNYNLVWNDDGLQEVPTEDDDTDGEVEVVSF